MAGSRSFEFMSTQCGLDYEAASRWGGHDFSPNGKHHRPAHHAGDPDCLISHLHATDRPLRCHTGGAHAVVRRAEDRCPGAEEQTALLVLRSAPPLPHSAHLLHAECPAIPFPPRDDPSRLQWFAPSGAFALGPPQDWRPGANATLAPDLWAAGHPHFQSEDQAVRAQPDPAAASRRLCALRSPVSAGRGAPPRLPPPRHPGRDAEGNCALGDFVGECQPWRFV